MKKRIMNGRNNFRFARQPPDPEHARAYLDDEPCDDARSGVIGEEPIMSDKEKICEQIGSIYPEIGECGIDVDVDWDEEKNVWAVDLKKDGHELKTYLESDDAEACMEGKQCVSLGLRIAQLKSNIEKM
jgi:hypothetical protein